MGGLKTERVKEDVFDVYQAMHSDTKIHES